MINPLGSGCGLSLSSMESRFVQFSPFPGSPDRTHSDPRSTNASPAMRCNFGQAPGPRRNRRKVSKGERSASSSSPLVLLALATSTCHPRAQLRDLVQARTPVMYEVHCLIPLVSLLTFTLQNRKRRPGREFVAVKRGLISPQSFGGSFEDMLGDFVRIQIRSFFACQAHLLRAVLSQTTKPLPKAPATEQVQVFMDQNRLAPPRTYASRKDLEDAGWERVRESSKADHHQLKQAQSMPVLRSGQRQPVERSHARTNQAPNPLVLQNGFRHQISAFASPPVQEMNFKKRMVCLLSVSLLPPRLRESLTRLRSRIVDALKKSRAGSTRTATRVGRLDRSRRASNVTSGTRLRKRGCGARDIPRTRS